MDINKTWATVREILDKQSTTITPLLQRVDVHRLTTRVVIHIARRVVLSITEPSKRLAIVLMST